MYNNNSSTFFLQPDGALKGGKEVKGDLGKLGKIRFELTSNINQFFCDSSFLGWGSLSLLRQALIDLKRVFRLPQSPAMDETFTQVLDPNMPNRPEFTNFHPYGYQLPPLRL